MPKTKKDSLESIFGIIYALRGLMGPWRKMVAKSSFLSDDEDIPMHIAKAQFIHLMDNDESFRSHVVEWCSKISIDLMESAKSVATSPVKTHGKILLSQDQAKSVRSGTVKSRVLEVLDSAPKPLTVAQIIKEVGSSYKTVYSCLTILHSEKEAKKEKKDGNVIWRKRRKPGRKPQSKALAKDHPNVRRRKRSVSGPHTEISGHIMNILSNGPMTIADLQSSLKGRDQIRTQNPYQEIYDQMNRLKSSGKVRKFKKIINEKERVVWEAISPAN